MRTLMLVWGGLLCACPQMSTPSDAGLDAADAGDVGDGEGDGGLLGLDARLPNPSCHAPQSPLSQSDAGVTTRRAFPSLSFSSPLALMQAPGDATLIYVMERAGIIRSFNNVADAGSTREVLNITAKVSVNGEGGLLGMAFDPAWATRKALYVSYTEPRGNGLRSVIARYKSTPNDGQSFDADQEEVLLELDQPYNNHNGGFIGFGPDGFLYIGLGDGGSGGDPLGAGQRFDTILGKMLRIDVNVPAAQRYAVPTGNPFVDGGVECNRTSSDYGVTPSARRCSEIYALGLRNPWRWSFDRGTGVLWVGDVGQDTVEEVDRLERGGNYGWRIREGDRCFGATTCSSVGLIDPILTYPRTEGRSITGGYVYRGTAVPQLVGRYVFGDYVSGRIWAIDAAASAPTRQLLVDSNFSIGSFGQTLDGEVYVLDMATGGIHQLVLEGPPSVSTLPTTLSATGCFDATDVKRPAAFLVPYAPRAELWSDGAAKERFFAVPDGTTIGRNEVGDFDFPQGTVLVKTFIVGGKRVETRLFMRHGNGLWAGYSYEWNDAETDATLLEAAKSKTLTGGQTWYYPSRAECMVCHTAAAGFSLGLETLQLNWAHQYPTGRRRNQLTTLSGLGFLTTPIEPVATLPALENPFGVGPLEARARAYLHSNCANCHRNNHDLRASTPLAMTSTCNVPVSGGNFGLSDPNLLTPGNPGNSMLLHRMKALTGGRMPPVASSAVDDAGVVLVDQWIRSLTACP